MYKIIFQGVLTVLIFLLWAAFALLIINPYFRNDLPGYTIGRLCIWEAVAFFVAAVIAHLLIKKWGYLTVEMFDNGQKKVSFHWNYILFFLLYFLLGLLIATWQFWLFSQRF